MKIFIGICALMGCVVGEMRGSSYDPLKLMPEKTISMRDFVVHDQARKREIPLRVYYPPEARSAAVILFSHGLGGSCQMGKFMGDHWAGRGFVVVFMQHVGSDTSVWEGKSRVAAFQAMHKAASAENFSLRVGDVSAVLDQLQVWNVEEGHALAGRLDLKRVGMSGHSFGAVTTQAVSGQKPFLPGKKTTDPRIRSAIAFSPSLPKLGSKESAFGSVSIPWMLMTGTLDNSPIGNATPESRQEVYPALPAGDKYELVLFGAEHSVFTERSLPGERGQRNPNHHPAILALSTAFWEAHLRDDAEAKDWLKGKGPTLILEKEDRWQWK
jgi:predicted dienelactone hydrolase